MKKNNNLNEIIRVQEQKRLASNRYASEKINKLLQSKGSLKKQIIIDKSKIVNEDLES